MGRPPRLLIHDGIYHVFARGVEKRAIFRDARDHRAYLRMIGDVVDRRRWRVMAYCLMVNHVHLLVQTPDADLDRGMQELHGAYARRFNWRHDRVGPVFQSRYGAKLVSDDAQLWTAVAYLAANPVKAKLCGRPRDWLWSSVRHAVGRTSGPPWLDTEHLLSLLHGDREIARAQLRRLMGEGD
jgi:REP element-mobilizing transposase RayT